MPDTLTRPDFPAIPGYRVTDELARGGMGRVLAATDRHLERDVAIKVLLPGMSVADAAARFVRESKITARLQHPGIPPVHQLGTLPDGSPFLAMKLIRGRTLATLLKERATPADDLPRFVQVFEQLCQAVGYAHSLGIVHRDLKPQNVMVGAFGEVQVMDWGLAKEMRNADCGMRNADKDNSTSASIPHSAFRIPNSPGGDLILTPDSTPPTAIAAERTPPGFDTTLPGQVLGTVPFMPPEQARGELDRIDSRSDVFALGGMLCILLTGQPPYCGRHLEALLRAAAECDTADALRRLDACGADPILIAVCRRCLAANPTDRPADGGAVAGLVAAHRADVEARLRKAEAEKAAVAARLAEQKKKRRVQLALAAAVVMIACGGGAFAWWQARQDGSRRAEQQRVEGERKAEKERADGDIRSAKERADGDIRARQATFDAERRVKGEQARTQINRLRLLAATLRTEYRFTQAADALSQARGAADSFLPELIPTISQAQTDLAFVRELDEIRLMRWALIGEKGRPRYFDEARAPLAYRRAFAQRGLEVAADSETVAAAVAASDVSPEVLAALDDWATLETDPAVRERVLAVARRVDSTPGIAAFRDPAVWADSEKLTDLAASPEVERLSPGLLVALADVMRVRGVNPVPMMRRAQLRHPRDFLIVLTLAQMIYALDPTDPEAIGAFRAALALRQDNWLVWNNLGYSLRDTGDVRGAETAFRAATRIDPDVAVTHYALGLLLKSQKDFDGAIDAYWKAILLDPGDAAVHNSLGVALAGRKDLNGAANAYRQAVQADPNYGLAHYNLGHLCVEKNDLAGATDAFHEAVRADPNHASAHNQLGVLQAVNGDLDGAIVHFAEAVRLEPGNPGFRANLDRARRLKADRDAKRPLAPPPREVKR